MWELYCTTADAAIVARRLGEKGILYGEKCEFRAVDDRVEYRRLCPKPNPKPKPKRLGYSPRTTEFAKFTSRKTYGLSRNY